MTCKAWRCEVKGDESATCYVLAPTRSAARFTVFASAKECGYTVPFGDIRVRRAPSLDAVLPVPRALFSEMHCAQMGWLGVL